MTETTLISIIMVLCGGTVNSNFRTPDEVRELRIQCFEEYTNCAINLKGILSLQDFTKKCVDPKRDKHK